MKNLVQNLINSNKLSSQKEIDNFIEALNQIKEDRDPNLISDLFLVFSDAAVHIPPMQTTQTYIESFDFNIWIPILVDKTPIINKQARMWTGDFYAHVLNSEDARQVLKKIYLNLNGDNRALITKVLKDVPEDESLDEELKTDLRSKVKMVIQ